MNLLAALAAALAVWLLAPPDRLRRRVPAARRRRHIWVPWLTRSRIRKRRAEAAQAFATLGGLLRAGRLPADALRTAARQVEMLAPAAAIADVGADVSEALLRLSRVPGYGRMAELAAAWRLSERTGQELAASLAALEAGLRADESVAQVVESELSAARATGKLLAVLPAAGIAIGFAVGGDPIGFFFGSPAGNLAFAAGLLLDLAGLVWVERIADG